MSWTARFIAYWRMHKLIATLLCLVMLGMLGLLGWWLWQQQRMPIVSPDYGRFDSREEYEAFVAEHPLMQVQEPPGSRFSIESIITADKRVEYAIALQAPAPKPGNNASFRAFLDTLQGSQEEALAWIRQQGVDPTTVYIEWSPDPADYLPGNELPDIVPNKENTASPTPTPRPQFPQ